MQKSHLSVDDLASDGVEVDLDSEFPVRVADEVGLSSTIFTL